MCNCGNKRTEYAQQATPGTPRQALKLPVQTYNYASFEYTGKTALTVTGNVTGRQYRFQATGARQDIDYRDIAGIVGIPVLRRIK
ncbi:hypothetical protein HB364_24090 [Pseudoflavitalea sp. X16]|uniref:hypothetical protein n=1 Tax=Paraflavitalea devenefica TaxID=2716334 RepID=UPI0014230696|nr:hypothetical protein [Paraflavitalea devenefica]NII28185.1 hypothetical protein [Paraflavitalea devenefica]